jgi:hypothetical protein
MSLTVDPWSLAGGIGDELLAFAREKAILAPLEARARP